MNTINHNNYYSDTTYITNSMLSNFVSFTKNGEKYYTPQLYKDTYISGDLSLVQTSPMLVGSIVDEHFSDGVNVFEKYKVVDLRTKAGKEMYAENPNVCISKTEMERVEHFINALENNERFLSMLEGEVDTQGILFGELEGLKVKGKYDFLIPGHAIVDLKTTGSYDTLYNDMQWGNVPNINHRYFRQLALYQYMEGNNLPCYLLVACDSSIKLNKDTGLQQASVYWLPIHQTILDYALESIKEDLRELKKYYDKDWKITSGDMNPFNIDKLIELQEQKKVSGDDDLII